MSVVCHDLSPPAVCTCGLETARGLIQNCASREKEKEKCSGKFSNDWIRLCGDLLLNQSWVSSTLGYFVFTRHESFSLCSGVYDKYSDNYVSMFE